jgi:hypothetical protein
MGILYLNENIGVLGIGASHTTAAYGSYLNTAIASPKRLAFGLLPVQSALLPFALLLSVVVVIRSLTYNISPGEHIM